MIFIAGISIALFISALILVKKDRSQADWFLLFWMILNVLQLTSYFLFQTEEIYNFPYLLGFQFPLPLLNGVLLYFYVASVTHQFPQKKWIPFLHLIPTLLTFIYIIPFLFRSVEEKIFVFKNKGVGYEIFMQVLLLAIFFSGVIYVVWSIILLRNHKKRIREEFSTIEAINLKWLRFLTYGLGLVWLIVIITQNDSMIYTGVSVFVILIGFFGVQQKDIFVNKHTTVVFQEQPQKTVPKEKAKYEHSGLTEEDGIKYFKKLTNLMTEEKVYKATELSLSDLANKLDIHPNYLSQIINEQANQSFYDYINSFRVKEFQRLLQIPENSQFTLIALAYDCGFNSKSTFNRYFKKMVGETPSQYAKKLTDSD